MPLTKISQLSSIGNTGVTGITIDSSGRMLTPARPAFRVYKNTNQTSSSNNETVTWEVESFDIGGNFASNTFTAPITGVYSFTVQWLSLNEGTQSDIFLNIAGNNFSNSRSAGEGTSRHKTCTLNFVGQVTSGQAVNVEISSAGQGMYGDSGGSWSYFCGFLIG
jgi:hypothetical protein